MICKLCKQFYLDEDTVIGLFIFSEICSHCKDKFEPNELYEVIPISNGLIEYHYLYENMNLNIRQKNYLNKYLSIFYQKIEKLYDEYDLFVFLDDNIYFETSYIGCLLEDYEHVFIFSLMRKELIYKDLF